MANEKRLTDANTLSEEISSLSMFMTGIRFGQGVLSEYIKEYRKSVLKIVDEAPTGDAVVVEDKELLKAIKLLMKQYAKSKASDYVHCPVAHALFHTWKQVEEKRSDG